MTTGLDHPLVAEYLQRLDDAARVLPPARHAELLAEIRSHLAEGLREAEATESGIRNMLQRLGSPADIVAGAVSAVGPRSQRAGSCCAGATPIDHARQYN